MPSPCIAAIALATAAVSDFGSSQGARTSLEYQFLSRLFLQRQCFFRRRLQINMLHGALQKSCAVRRYPRRRMARVAMSVLLFEGNKKTQQCPSYIYCFLVAAGYCHCHLTASVSTKLVTPWWTFATFAKLWTQTLRCFNRRSNKSHLKSSWDKPSQLVGLG